MVVEKISGFSVDELTTYSYGFPSSGKEALIVASNPQEFFLFSFLASAEFKIERNRDPTVNPVEHFLSYFGRNDHEKLVGFNNKFGTDFKTIEEVRKTLSEIKASKEELANKCTELELWERVSLLYFYLVEGGLL